MKLFYRLSENPHGQLEQIRHQLEQTKLANVDEVELNLEEVHIPDSTLLRQLLQLHIFLRSYEVRLQLTNLNDSSRRILHQSSLHRFFDQIHTQPSA